MTTLTLAEAIAAIDTAMKTHDPTVLDDLEILTHDGQRVPLRSITWDQIQAELDADRVMIEAQLALNESAGDLLPELEAFFGDLAPQALSMLQSAVYESWPVDADLPLIPHPSGVGTALEPAYIVAEWRDMDDHDRRLMRGRLDLEERVGDDWPHLARAWLDYFTNRHGDLDIDLTELDESGELAVALMFWDDSSPENRDVITGIWGKVRGQ